MRERYKFAGGTAIEQSAHTAQFKTAELRTANHAAPQAYIMVSSQNVMAYLQENRMRYD